MTPANFFPVRYLVIDKLTNNEYARASISA
jgi:hypothetical protein